MAISSRKLAFTAAMGALAITISILTIPFILGVRIHFFQIGTMLAGAVAGPFAGVIAGAVGGIYVASLRDDPTITVGNGMLGFFTGIFSERLHLSIHVLVGHFRVCEVIC